MAYTQYFGSKPVSDWQANGPAESGHNFIDQINEQKGKVEGQENKVAEQQNYLNGARDAYNNAYQNQQNYSNLYNTAKGSEGVDDAKNQYQKSLASVNATAAAMNTLPSSVNANSNVVLTQNQRNAALGNQMTKYQNTMDYWTRQNAGDLSQYQTALASAQDLAKTNMGQEQARVNQTMNAYQTEMNQINALYDQLLQERQIMRSIYGDMYEDEYRHMQEEIEAWAQNLNAETQRYAQDQATARNNATLAAEKYAADAGLRLQQYLQQQEEAKQAKLNEPTLQSYISTNGNAWSPQTGATSVEPIVTYRDNGKNGYNRVENYVASPEMLAQLMYGSN
jgi:hypothetical protein